jgi:hypothetical protein
MTYRLDQDPTGVSVTAAEAIFRFAPSAIYSTHRITTLSLLLGVNCPLIADWNIFDSKRDEICSSLAVVSAHYGFAGHGFAHSDPDTMD